MEEFKKARGDETGDSGNSGNSDCAGMKIGLIVVSVLAFIMFVTILFCTIAFAVTDESVLSILIRDIYG